MHSASLRESLGGADADFVAAALGQSLASIPFVPCIISTALPLQDDADDPVIGKLLRDVVAGNMLVTTALIEHGNEAAHAPSTLT